MATTALKKGGPPTGFFVPEAGFRRVVQTHGYCLTADLDDYGVGSKRAYRLRIEFSPERSFEDPEEAALLVEKLVQTLNEATKPR